MHLRGPLVERWLSHFDKELSFSRPYEVWSLDPSLALYVNFVFSKYVKAIHVNKLVTVSDPTTTFGTTINFISVKRIERLLF